MAYHWLPESPRVLILRQKDEQAKEVLHKVYPFADDEIIDLKLLVIKQNIEATTRISRSLNLRQRTARVWTHKPFRRSIFTVCLIQVFGQFTG